VAAVDDGDSVDLGAEDKLELNLEEDEPRAWYRHRLTRVLYVAFSAFAGLVIGLGAMFVLVVNSSKDSRGATCSVVEANRKEKREQLQQYEESPPSTELAKRLQQTYKESLASWDHLWSTLGCKDSAPPTP